MRGGDFWSRRRAKVAEEQEADTKAVAERSAEETRVAWEAEDDETILAHFGLPNPDDLKPGDKIAAFLRREIPERIKRRAMRKLWTSNPVLACLDGLNDYDDDYTAAATDAPGVKTAYRLGQGMQAHVDALAAEAERKAAPPPSAEETPAAEEDEAPTEVALAATEDVPDEASTTLVAVEAKTFTGDVMENPDDEPPVRPRRMRFRFDQDAT